MASILIVEDDATIAEAFALALGHDGYEVMMATNGLEALEKIEETTPDLILLDILMPSMNGVEFLEKFKPSDHPKTQIVVFSNMAADSTLGAIKALGVVHYLTKAHYTPQDISHLVKQLLAGQGS